MSTQDRFEELLTDALRGLLERGFKLPFHFACIAINGSVVAGTYSADDAGYVACEITAQHTVAPGFEVPLNTMYIDADGDAARVLFGPDGKLDWSNN